MKYEDFVNEDLDQKDVKPLSIGIKKWKEEGDFLVGQLLDQKVFEGGKFEGSCNQYTFITDNGLVSTILGAASDKVFNEKHLINKIILIKFHGKLELDDGRKCNSFTISDITEAYEKTGKDPKKELPDE